MLSMKLFKSVYYRLGYAHVLKQKLKRKKDFLDKNDSREFIFSSNYGFEIFINKDKVVDRDFYFDNFEKEIIKMFRKFIGKKITVFDVGANIGIFSLTAASKANSNIAIYAFEPSLYAFNQLKKNIELNNFTCIKPFNHALSDFTGNALLNFCEDDAYNSLGSCPQEKILETKLVPVSTITEFCKNNKIRKIDILKMDTEGAEYLILKGASEFITKSPIPIIFSEYNREVISGFNFSLKDLESFFIQNNYSIFEILNSRLVEFNSNKSTSSNLICIHKSYMKTLGVSFFIKY
jgi:FkbM family methyltransferase